MRMRRMMSETQPGQSSPRPFKLSVSLPLGGMPRGAPPGVVTEAAATGRHAARLPMSTLPPRRSARAPALRNRSLV